ncbi:MAG: hypothetical protein BWY49_00246 [Candidatus Omnitrophica bacterium ADurb.Bin314]|nr:MAG: hypothetical protein BWY49_00246 [Candidatus Omnitrophica bacterium ADurb.Bin314]
MERSAIEIHQNLQRGRHQPPLFKIRVPVRLKPGRVPEFKILVGRDRNISEGGSDFSKSRRQRDRLNAGRIYGLIEETGNVRCLSGTVAKQLRYLDVSREPGLAVRPINREAQVGCRKVGVKSRDRFSCTHIHAVTFLAVHSVVINNIAPGGARRVTHSQRSARDRGCRAHLEENIFHESIGQFRDRTRSITVIRRDIRHRVRHGISGGIFSKRFIDPGRICCIPETGLTPDTRCHQTRPVRTVPHCSRFVIIFFRG